MVTSPLSGGEPAITGSLIEIGALRALGLATSGDDAAAVDALAAALTLACPQGYVRVFADEGPPMAALLAELIAAQRSGRGGCGDPARLAGPAPARLVSWPVQSVPRERHVYRFVLVSVLRGQCPWLSVRSGGWEATGTGI